MASKNLYSQSAKFEDVLVDEVALSYHSDRYQSGHRDNLAKHCYQYLELRKQKESK
jgi:hypothetical protein